MLALSPWGMWKDGTAIPKLTLWFPGQSLLKLITSSREVLIFLICYLHFKSSASDSEDGTYISGGKLLHWQSSMHGISTEETRRSLSPRRNTWLCKGFRLWLLLLLRAQERPSVADPYPLLRQLQQQPVKG